ncbi:N-formylglutamate amidohydrolase [Jannaschia seohaensis]|uniref:Predicted N-formylglutamate amidohydrolase n=1 Tax=Jannaschia seohaensis TaxID=475081 RepID=A0A2Y9BBY0_9RHOB|nr:N-formylglutamate amidohydrolase [Jannaschia seohaensis]PWJ10058.1 putative N-formylglutamate amidohydrolase [Jannaschia seohaensis]SSA51819.1 Predicted N-formylglutamate amidohydrolase [Jannaschia seohaensis]
MQRDSSPSGLLGPRDPSPVEISGGRAPLLLTVEHAGRGVPERLSDMGLPAGEIDRHIGWDIGALDLARAMAARLPATLVAQRYSRLVIDVNRPWDASDLVPETADGTEVPANAGLDGISRQQRWDEIHRPFHDAVAAGCDNGAKALVAVHTYDPRRRADPEDRPWPVGLLWRQGNPLAEGLAARLSDHAAALPLGINAPYEIEDESDFTIPMHAERRGLPHVLIEVRNDFVRDAAGILLFADLLSQAILDLELT